MAVTIRPLTPGFAGEVAGVDLRRAITRDEVAAIEAGMDEFAVLVFHDQDITDEQQVAFTRNFGDIELSEASNVTSAGQRRLSSQLSDISNLDRDNKLLARDDRRRMFNLGNQLWHSDSAFRATPAKYSLLSARIIPDQGGNTEFADMRAAYDALDEATKTQIADLITEHSIAFSRGELGFDAYADKVQPVRHSLVRTNPMTGRKSLYLSAHIGGIIGWPVPEARAFIRDLTEHATQPQFTHAHQWHVNDLVMWDNRTTMHRARRYRDLQEIRDLRRTSIKGTNQLMAAQ
jgi:alpha-ketoglutarate-dependent 2,4-dichlorophenoxyacetate dioxygenase